MMRDALVPLLGIHVRFSGTNPALVSLRPQVPCRLHALRFYERPNELLQGGAVDAVWLERATVRGSQHASWTVGYYLSVMSDVAGGRLLQSRLIGPGDELELELRLCRPPPCQEVLAYAMALVRVERVERWQPPQAGPDHEAQLVAMRDELRAAKAEVARLRAVIDHSAELAERRRRRVVRAPVLTVLVDRDDD